MEMSYGEKSAWVSLIALVGAFGWYVYSHAAALIDGSLSSADVPAALIALIVLIVIVELTSFAVLGLESRRKSAIERDERDVLIDARSDRAPYVVIFAGAIAGIWTAALQSPVVTQHVLLGALVAAELVKLIGQLVYYRRGF